MKGYFNTKVTTITKGRLLWNLGDSVATSIPVDRLRSFGGTYWIPLSMFRKVR